MQRQISFLLIFCCFFFFCRGGFVFIFLFEKYSTKIAHRTEAETFFYLIFIYFAVKCRAEKNFSLFLFSLFITINAALYEFSWNTLARGRGGERDEQSSLIHLFDCRFEIDILTFHSLSFQN